MAVKSEPEQSDDGEDGGVFEHNADHAEREP